MEFKTVLSDRAASLRGRLSLLDQLYKEVALVRIFGLLLKAQSFATTTKLFFHLLAALLCKYAPLIFPSGFGLDHLFYDRHHFRRCCRNSFTKSSLHR
jgi:hypothetical protein